MVIVKIDFNIKYVGKISQFGGPDDNLVSPTEGLALCERVEDKPKLFLPYQPLGTTGLARRLDPEALYCAMPWDYSLTPKPLLRRGYVKVFNPKSQINVNLTPIDWGPHPDTGRLVDVSEAAMKILECRTDDVVECTLILLPNTNRI